MIRLLQALVLLVLLWFVVSQLLPWFQGKQSGPTDSSAASGSVGGSFCVGLAERTVDATAGQIRGMGRPDPETWDLVHDNAAARIHEARTACACSSPACDAASRALDELDELLTDLGAMASGDPDYWADPGARMNRIQELLDEARRGG